VHGAFGVEDESRYSISSTSVMRWDSERQRLRRAREFERGVAMGWVCAGHHRPFEGRGFRLSILCVRRCEV